MPINVFCELPTKQSQSECFGENSRSLPMAKFLRTTCCWTSPNFSSTSAHVIGPIYLLAHLLSLARSVETARDAMTDGRDWNLLLPPPLQKHLPLPKYCACFVPFTCDDIHDQRLGVSG